MDKKSALYGRDKAFYFKDGMSEGISKMKGGL